MLGLFGAALVLAAVGDEFMPYTAAEREAEVRAHCAREWGNDFSMQAFCRKRGREGADTFTRLYIRYRGTPGMIDAIRECLGQWTSGGSVDFSMAAFCATRQEQAWLELQR
jgi:hypothetical protein